MIFQQFNLVGRLSVLENVLTGRLGHRPAWPALFRRFSPEDYRLAEGCLARVGLADRAGQRADTLSGGERQRWPWPGPSPSSRAWLLADEPVASLDPTTARVVLELLRRVCREDGLTALVSLHNPNLVVTNSEYYPTFLCALIRRILDLDAGFGSRIAAITTWAFYMEGKRFFEGNRTLVTSENVEKPILNALRMLARLGDTRLAVEASHRRDVLVAGAADTEVDALAALGGQRLAVLVWHQADTWWAEGEADVELTVAGAPFAGPARVRHWRIDGGHSNAYGEWLRLGRPEDPPPAQVARLKSRQGLEMLEPPRVVSPTAAGALVLRFPLPLHATSLLEIEPAG